MPHLCSWKFTTRDQPALERCSSSLEYSSLPRDSSLEQEPLFGIQHRVASTFQRRALERQACQRIDLMTSGSVSFGASSQPKERPEDMSHEAWRWMLVEGFVKNFNNHRKKFVIPSWMICVDESICRWYGLGGHWINMGLPMYISFDRKPEDGCEVQNSCCGISNIMLQLKLVKSEREESRLASQRYVCCCLLFAVCASTMGWDLPINVLLYFGACQPR
jgi:hypothetical protein